MPGILTEPVRLRLSPETQRLLRVFKEEHCFASVDALIAGLVGYAHTHPALVLQWVRGRSPEALTSYGNKRLNDDAVRFKVPE